MNSILSGLAGAMLLATASGSAWILWKAWCLFSSLIKSFNKVSQGIYSLKMTNEAMLQGFADVSLQLRKLSGELEFLRTVMTSGAPPEAEPGAAPEAPGPRTPIGKPIPPFPQWQPFVAAVDAPDAEESDTEVIDTTDEELVQQEQLDEIRGKGFAAGPEADPMENPPGVTANV